MLTNKTTNQLAKYTSKLTYTHTHTLDFDAKTSHGGIVKSVSRLATYSLFHLVRKMATPTAPLPPTATSTPLVIFTRTPRLDAAVRLLSGASIPSTVLGACVQRLVAAGPEQASPSLLEGAGGVDGATATATATGVFSRTELDQLAKRCSLSGGAGEAADLLCALLHLVETASCSQAATATANGPKRVARELVALGMDQDHALAFVQSWVDGQPAWREAARRSAMVGRAPVQLRRIGWEASVTAAHSKAGRLRVPTALFSFDLISENDATTTTTTKPSAESAQEMDSKAEAMKDWLPSTFTVELNRDELSSLLKKSASSKRSDPFSSPTLSLTIVLPFCEDWTFYRVS